MAKISQHNRQVFFRLDAHYRLIIAIISAIITFFVLNGRYPAPATILIIWIVFAFVVIVMDWISILTCHPREVRKIASLQDSSRTFIFLFVIVAAVISLGAIIFLLKSAKGSHTGGGVAFSVILSLTSVIVSWWLVHTIFTLRYAHLYYSADNDAGETKPYGGLEFPGKEEAPDYLDFVYFSFVIGMTFQVSDVEISSRIIRRMALLHALIAFAFNTAIVALSINVISGLV